MAECLQYEALAHKAPDVVFVRPRQARMLRRGPAKIVLITLGEMDAVVAQLAQCRSKAEFVNLRKKLFSDYVNLSYIIANSFSLPDNRSIRQFAVNQAFNSVQRLFETEGVARLGSEAIREAVFCVETLRRAYRLLGMLLDQGDVSEEMRESDRKLASNFNSSALWSQMHLHCLHYVITQRSPVDEDTLKEILQGMRLAVMAYSDVRGGFELRTTREPFLSAETLDQEDKELLDESFEDIESSLDAES